MSSLVGPTMNTALGTFGVLALVTLTVAGERGELRDNSKDEGCREQREDALGQAPAAG